MMAACRRETRRRELWVTLGVVVLTLTVMLAVPSVALAREYSVNGVDIEATVDADGAVTISDKRTYDFDGDFNGIYWDVPKGTYEGRDLDTQIKSVSVVSGDASSTFEQGSDGQRGTYEISDHGSYYQLKMYWPASDEKVTFEVDYTVPNLASRWADTAELYWQFVPRDPDSEGEWTNVRAVVHLPVPQGEPVNAGENVRAWGHGPLDATVSFEGDDIAFFAPGVGSNEYLEARIVFPASWLQGAQASTESRLDAILAEEQQWADEANAQRARARMMLYGTYAVMGGYAVLTAAVTLILRLRYARTHKAQFSDTYFRDVPSDDHPAVLGALYRGGDPSEREFAASLMRLADMGKLQMDYVKYQKKGLFGRMKEKEDYRLLQLDRIEGGVRGDASAAACERIDRATLKFLFQTVANHHSADESLNGPNGEPYVLTSYFEDVARKHPESYDSGYNNWKSSVTSSCETRGFYKDEGKTGVGLCVALGVLGIFVGLIGVFVGAFLDVPIPIVIGLMLLNIVVGIVCIVVGATMKERSREAIELKAKLEALRRWLKEFTRLDEAIPTDVVLWNRLLVMATVLGVAEEVIKQLQVAMPRILEDPYFYSYGWYYYGRHGMRSPMSAVTSSFSQAHSVSAAKLASSSDSSGGGGGGGFSGGGGGGFSGGGRGGAF